MQTGMFNHSFSFILFNIFSICSVLLEIEMRHSNTKFCRFNLLIFKNGLQLIFLVLRKAVCRVMKVTDFSWQWFKVSNGVTNDGWVQFSGWSGHWSGGTGLSCELFRVLGIVRGMVKTRQSKTVSRDQKEKDILLHRNNNAPSNNNGSKCGISIWMLNNFTDLL